MYWESKQNPIGNYFCKTSLQHYLERFSSYISNLNQRLHWILEFSIITPWLNWISAYVYFVIVYLFETAKAKKATRLNSYWIWLTDVFLSFLYQIVSRCLQIQYWLNNFLNCEFSHSLLVLDVNTNNTRTSIVKYRQVT